VMSIIVVHIRRRNTYTVHRAQTQKKKKTCNKRRLLLLLLSFSIYRCCDTHTHTGASRVMHVHLTLFCLFFSLALTYAVSLFGGIYHRWVLKRKERGEDVYECMLGQTLNMMKAVRRVIQSTVLKKRRVKRKMRQ
jgi:hypothetical protein